MARTMGTDPDDETVKAIRDWIVAYRSEQLTEGVRRLLGIGSK